jgi:homogentisate phytyltransferase/homogentisate geranylgeranyltransferase
MKDIPDVEGDRRHSISTFVLTLGAARTLLLCRLILAAFYAGIIVAGLVGVPGVSGWVLAGTHAAALVVMWLLGSGVDAADNTAVRRYYMIIWKLFYFEFLAFPLAVVLAAPLGR